MGNTFAWPIVRLVQRLSMILTLGCCLYVGFFLLSKSKDNSVSENSKVVLTNNVALFPSSSAFDLKPYNASVDAKARDIFSMETTDGATGAVDNTPKGQLPDHLKVVGILIAHPSQIIIEDSSANKTYFINEGTPQAGLKIVQVTPDKMVINYQGQNIDVPITKN